jgi:hypothetical protein
LEPLKGRIEYHLIEDLYDIKAGIALNGKIAGLGFLDSTVRLDFNMGFKSSSPIFRKWCEDLLYFIGKKEKSADVALPKSFNLQKRFSNQCRAARESQ